MCKLLSHRGAPISGQRPYQLLVASPSVTASGQEWLGASSSWADTGRGTTGWAWGKATAGPEVTVPGGLRGGAYTKGRGPAVWRLVAPTRVCMLLTRVAREPIQGLQQNPATLALSPLGDTAPAGYVLVAAAGLDLVTTGVHPRPLTLRGWRALNPTPPLLPGLLLPSRGLAVTRRQRRRKSPGCRRAAGFVCPAAGGQPGSCASEPVLCHGSQTAGRFGGQRCGGRCVFFAHLSRTQLPLASG